jgi:hypothetical protein
MEEVAVMIIDLIPTGKRNKCAVSVEHTNPNMPIKAQYWQLRNAATNTKIPVTGLLINDT